MGWPAPACIRGQGRQFGVRPANRRGVNEWSQSWMFRYWQLASSVVSSSTPEASYMRAPDQAWPRPIMRTRLFSTPCWRTREFTARFLSLVARLRTIVHLACPATSAPSWRCARASGFQPVDGPAEGRLPRGRGPCITCTWWRPEYVLAPATTRVGSAVCSVVQRPSRRECR